MLSGKDIRNHFVAYLDILGMKNKILESSADESADVINKINQRILTIEEIVKMLNKHKTLFATHNLEVKIFSDNIVLYAERDWYSLLIAASYIQAKFIADELLVRGALCYNELYADERWIYGKGLVNAYEIENNTAIYPRIIIDDTFIEGMKNCPIVRLLGSDSVHELTYNQFMEQGFHKIFIDNDSDWPYINYLGFWNHLSNNGKFTSDDYDLMAFLKQHKILIENNIDAHKEKKKILQKYLWCRGCHNRFCKAYDFPELMIK